MSVNWRAARVSVINKLYDLLGENVWLDDARVGRIAAVIDVSPHTLNGYAAELARNGIIERRYHGVSTGTGGRTASWRLPLPRHEAIANMNEYWDKYGGHYRGAVKPEPKPEPKAQTKAEIRAEQDERIAVMQRMENVHRAKEAAAAVTLATRESEQVRAIAGPDEVNPFEELRALRKDEGAALIEAASQYKDRTSIVSQKLRELESLGVHIDPASVVLEKDDVLEHVSLVLPYVISLERRIAVYEKTVASLQEQVKGVSELRGTVNKQKQQIDRLIAEKVARAS